MVKNEWGVVTIDLGIKAWAVAGMLIKHRSGNFMEKAETTNYFIEGCICSGYALRNIYSEYHVLNGPFSPRDICKKNELNKKQESERNIDCQSLMIES